VYFSEKLDKNINNFLSTLIVNDHLAPEPNGNVKTTAHMGNILADVEGFRETFGSLLVKYVIGYANLLGKEVKKVNFNRVWVNEVFKGASAKIHTHENVNLKNHLVAIFYYKVPKYSSHYVIVHDKECLSRDIMYYSMFDKSYIKIETGDLIIHDSKIPHGISEHSSDESRISFIFDINISE
jgi:hypothetical protein